MAKAPTSDAIMPADKMKPLLALSKKEPVQAAMGLSADGDGVLLLDKKASPRKVLSLLRGHADKAKLKLNGSSLRFGRAVVDVDHDPGVVRLFINKEPPGPLRMKLTEVVKRVPYQRVEFEVDPSLEEEHEHEGEGAEVQAAGAAAPQDAATPAAAAAPPPPPAPPPPSQAQQKPSIEALRLALAGLVGAMKTAIAAEPARKDGLQALAVKAQGHLKANEVEGAAAAIEQLKHLLQAAPATAGPAHPPAAAGAVSYAKARLAWIKVRQNIEGDLARLRDELMLTYEDEAPDIVKAIQMGYRSRTEPVLLALDEELADRLDEATNEADPAKRAAMVDAARQTLDRYQSFVSSDPIIADLDENPFVPLQIGTTLGVTLKTLSAALH